MFIFRRSNRSTGICYEELFSEKDPPPLPVIEDDDPNVEYQALNEDNAIWRDNASAS